MKSREHLFESVYMLLYTVILPFNLPLSKLILFVYMVQKEIALRITKVSENNMNSKSQPVSSQSYYINSFTYYGNICGDFFFSKLGFTERF